MSYKLAEQVSCVKYQGMGVEPLGEKPFYIRLAVRYFIRCMSFLKYKHTTTALLAQLILSEGEFFMKKENIRKRTIRITLTAVFLGMALVAKSFLSFTIPVFGGSGLRVGFAGIFTAFPAFLFGPLYGGITSALSDFIGYLIKPEGAYIPLLSVTAFCGGVIKGLVWKLFKDRSVRYFKIVIAVILLVITVLSGVVWGNLKADGVNSSLIATENSVLCDYIDSAEQTLQKENLEKEEPEEITHKLIVRRAISDLKEKDISPVTEIVLSLSNYSSAKSLAGYINLVTLGPVCVAILGFILLGLDSLMPKIRKRRINKKTANNSVSAAFEISVSQTAVPYVRIFLTIFASGLFVTTVNTVILKYFIAAWAGRSFWLLLIPRLAEEILISIIQTYFISALYGIYELSAKRFR